jgi:hypothetical protein
MKEIITSTISQRQGSEQEQNAKEHTFTQTADELGARAPVASLFLPQSKEPRHNRVFLSQSPGMEASTHVIDPRTLAERWFLTRSL